MNLTIIILGLLILVFLEVSYLIYKLNKKQSIAKSNMIFVDTSVLMDGRILSIADSGFITGVLVIPRSVIGELQFLADNSDSDKRARARKALDVVKQLQDNQKVEVLLLQDGSKAKEGVDERLLNLAKQYGGYVMTIDFNLIKVATVEDIKVLNVNQLSQSIRMAYLPGEKMNLELVQKGQEAHQAVGYLSDGTMVVVEQANNLIGQTREVEVIRSLQTSAGKMMFAKLVKNQSAAVKKVKPLGKRPVFNKKPKTERTVVKTADKPKTKKIQRRTNQSAESNLIDLVEKSNR